MGDPGKRGSVNGSTSMLAVLGWLLAGGALFAWLFSLDASDDYAGWVPVVMVLHAPAGWALLGATPAGPMRVGRALALALPAGLVTGEAVWVVSLCLGIRIGSDHLLLFLLLVAWGVLAAAVIAGVFYRTLRRVAHPAGARRVLAVVAGAAVLALAAVLTLGAAVFPGAEADALDRGIAAGAWILAGVPLAWLLPVALVSRLRG